MTLSIKKIFWTLKIKSLWIKKGRKKERNSEEEKLIFKKGDVLFGDESVLAYIEILYCR